MKKIIIALLAALLLLTACQPTPEAAVVVQKDFGQLTEKAKLDESHVPDLLLSESLKAPKTLHKALENKQGNVKVYIEADVTVPDAKGLPMIRVGHGSFTRDDIRRFADVLFNGAMPLDPNNKKYTKSMIQESIDRLIKMRESGDLDMKYESVEQVDADIAELMAKLETAPDTMDVAEHDFRQEYPFSLQATEDFAAISNRILQKLEQICRHVLGIGRHARFFAIAQYKSGFISGNRLYARRSICTCNANGGQTEYYGFGLHRTTGIFPHRGRLWSI